MRPFQDMRHSSITNSAAASTSPAALMDRAGHSDFKTTQGYIDLAGETFLVTETTNCDHQPMRQVGSSSSTDHRRWPGSAGRAQRDPGEDLALSSGADDLRPVDRGTHGVARSPTSALSASCR